MIKLYDGETFKKQFRRRRLGDYPEALQAVREILAAVRQEGDGAVLAYTEKFDGVRLLSLRASEEEFTAALVKADSRIIDDLRQAAENIRAFHARQLRRSWLDCAPDGVITGHRITPLKRVGVYVPGGAAAYPSTVLMTVIPARVAGVDEVVMVTPPGRDGTVNPYTLAAARIAGADAVYKCGGAQAVAALAYGTETIPAVDKIVGPGNLYVTLAKQEVAGLVGIDMPAGPSEILVVADETARLDFVAADMLSQAEHDPLAAAYCVTTSRQLAEELPAELERQCKGLERQETARLSLAEQGTVVLVETLSEAVEIVNLLAPEHLELLVQDPWKLLGQVRNAGAVFLGAYTPEPIGDYWAGPNHVLPTAGTGRFSSVLSVDDFIKKSSIIYYPPEALLRDAPAVERLAVTEGLTAHSRAVAIRRGFLAKKRE